MRAVRPGRGNITATRLDPAHTAPGVVDPDPDGDGIADPVDTLPPLTSRQADKDATGIGDASDIFRTTPTTAFQYVETLSYRLHRGGPAPLLVTATL